METDRVYRTNELERTGLPAAYVVWFKTADTGRVSIEMSLAGLLRLEGLVRRAVDAARAMSPDEMNAYEVVKEEAKSSTA